MIVEEPATGQVRRVFARLRWQYCWFRQFEDSDSPVARGSLTMGLLPVRALAVILAAGNVGPRGQEA